MQQTESLPPRDLGCRWCTDLSVIRSGIPRRFRVRYVLHLSHLFSARSMTILLAESRVFPMGNPNAIQGLDRNCTFPLAVEAIGLLTLHPHQPRSVASVAGNVVLGLVLLIVRERVDVVEAGNINLSGAKRLRGVTTHSWVSWITSASMMSSAGTGPASSSCTCWPVWEPKILLIMPGPPSPPPPPRALIVSEKPSRSDSS